MGNENVKSEPSAITNSIRCELFTTLFRTKGIKEHRNIYIIYTLPVHRTPETRDLVSRLPVIFLVKLLSP